MKNRIPIQIFTMLILFAAPTFAANPFLDAKDDKPVSATFRGTEWNDENIDGETTLTARVVTTRIATMSWGAIFKIEYVGLQSRSPEKREIRPDYFIVTDDRIVLLNEEDNVEAAKKIGALERPPTFEQNDIYGITSGHFVHQEVLWKTTINVKGDLCLYESSHPSGHYRKIVWKKGVGLVEYASNYGAMKDGFHLKRATSKK